MRYKNLTITITLMCLSIVGLAGLVLLPISNGVCKLYQHGWTYYNNNTAANIIITEDTKGKSWQVFAYVDAKAVNARVYPDDHNLSHFKKDDTFEGFGYVTAARHNYTKYHESGDWAWCWATLPGGVCGGHFVKGDIDTNRPESPFYNGGDTALTLDIEANAEVVKHTGRGYKKEDSRKKELKVSIDLDAPIVPKAGIEFTDAAGTTKYISTEKSVKVKVHNPVPAQEVGVEAQVDFDPEANSSAHADFDFEGHYFDDGSVWYNAPDE